MPRVISNTDLRNGYDEVSTWCHHTNEAAFVTRDGAGDLAVMSMEAYDEMRMRLDLYELVEAGRRDAASGRVTPAREHVGDLRERYGLR